MTEIDNFSPIIRTKLQRPSVPLDFLRRPRLQEALDTFRLRPLTLVSAAAGYGKSTLVSGWLNELDCQSAWVTLDESDNDLRQFLGYLVAAVQTVFPSALKEIDSLLGVANLPPVEFLTASLLNELDELVEPFVLVLDDFQYIRERAVLELLAQVTNHPPRNLHLVLVGRRDPFLPIAKLRARGQLTEIRVEDLRFTLAETEAFLKKVLETNLDAETVSAWLEGTEGWVTGLSLAILALGANGSIPKQPFKLLKSKYYTMQYLLQEVLERQQPSVRIHLLSSSISARFCDSLCDVLREVMSEVDANGMNGADFFLWLEETLLFVIPLDEERRWFRYHHLFRELLRQELERRYGRDLVVALHLRASEWFESDGLVEEALHHALAAEDSERAAQLLELNARALLNGDKWYVLEKWLSKLPEVVVEKKPQLLLVKVLRYYYRLEWAAIPPILTRIDDLMGGDAETHELSGEVALFRGFCLFFQNEGTHSLKYLEQALKLIPVNNSFRVLAEILFGLANQMEGRMEEVTGTVTEWLENRSQLSPLRENRLLQLLMFVHYIAGALTGAEHYIPKQREIAVSHCLENAIAWCDCIQGLIHLQRGELDEATRLLETAVKRKYFHYPRAAVDALAALTLAYQANGQSDRAHTTLQSLVQFAAHLGDSFSSLADSCAARLALAQGRLEPAIRWLKTTAPPAAEVAIFWWEIPCLTRCQVLIAEGSAASLREAAERLQEYAAMNESNHNTCQLIRILALQSLVYQKQDKVAEANIVLERALRLARSGGFIFPFLELGSPMVDLLKCRLAEKSRNADFIKHILTAYYQPVGVTDFAGSPTARGTTRPRQPLTEPLTSRELEVLELLAQTLYQKEIAKKLFVSRETVKTHLKHIYQKLGVSNRQGALAKASALGLLTS